MNQQQKEALKAQLKDEEAVIKNVKGIYKKALDDIDDKISALMGRTDAENLQSIIYQVEYQKALKQQISGILDAMNGEQFTSISEFLTKSYENGFVGTMYDLNKQGIPLILPIDQNQVVAAVQHETKLSKSLYDTLGEDTNLLKKRIANNISRGIAQGSSYAEITKNIASRMVGNYGKYNGGAISRAFTIARTEGHRINQKAAYDAQFRAKEKGADVLKQWDASLDARTRDSHAKVNGQIKELDEKFSNGLRYPGDPSGPAAEVVNCRCVLTQRARWALDADELKRLQEEAEYFEVDKTEEFEEFKTKYLKAAEEINYPFKDKKFYMTPDGELIETDIDDQLHDLYSLEDVSETEVAESFDEWLKDTKQYKYYYDENGQIHVSGYIDPITEGKKFNESIWTMNEDGTFTEGKTKYQAQYKIDISNKNVVTINGVQYVPGEETMSIINSLPKNLKDEIIDTYNSFGGAAKYDDVVKSVLEKHGYKGINIIDFYNNDTGEVSDIFKLLDDSLLTKTKKSKLETLNTSLTTQTKKLAKIDNKSYTGIWYNQDVSVSEYSTYKGKIQSKRDYYLNELKTETNPSKIALYKKYLDDLDEFEDLGKQYEAIQNKITKIKADITKLSPKSTSVITGDAFTKERKDTAYWFTDTNGSTQAADAVLRDKSGEVWRNASSDEKYAIQGYTSSYSKINEPLRGYEYMTNKYLGVGNVDLNQIGVGYGYSPGVVKKQIDDMTNIIEKSSYDFDIWTNRGVRRDGMDKFFGISQSDFDLPEAELAAKLVGTTPTEHAFTSVGVAKGKGFSGQIKLNIYCPKGTKMMYAEPFSAYGNGFGKNWDGISKQTTFGTESEMILQRETTFRVTKVEKSNGIIYIDMDVIDQSH